MIIPVAAPAGAPSPWTNLRARGSTHQPSVARFRHPISYRSGLDLPLVPPPPPRLRAAMPHGSAGAAPGPCADFRASPSQPPRPLRRAATWGDWLLGAGRSAHPAIALPPASPPSVAGRRRQEHHRGQPGGRARGTAFPRGADGPRHSRHPTQHQFLGLPPRSPGLQALLREEIDTMEQALTPTAVRNLTSSPAGGRRPLDGPSRGRSSSDGCCRQIWHAGIARRGRR